MSERYEWVEIVEPRTLDHMYANLMTGECSWQPPSGVKIKKTSENDNQWWELYDANTSRYYYYNASSKKTVWQKPLNCDIIPLAKLQNLKPAIDTTDQDDGDDRRPVVHREMSTQTPAVRKESHCTNTGSLNRTKTSPLQSNRHRNAKSSKTVRLPGKSSIDLLKDSYSPELGHLDGLQNNVHRERNQRVGPREEIFKVSRSDSKTQARKFSDSIQGSEFEKPVANDFARLQKMAEMHQKSSIPDGSMRIPRPYTAVRTGHSDTFSKGKKENDSMSVLFSPRLHMSRRTESQRLPGPPPVGLVIREPLPSQPQRSLESPKPLPQAAVVDAHAHALTGTTGKKSVDLKRTAMDVSWTSSDVDPKFGATRGPSSNSHFQRQDSFPTMRESSSRMQSWQQQPSPSHFQDVSQITAVQVTPRPKPRAFPRTNPSFMGTQRRDGGVSVGSYRKVSDVNHQRMSPADIGHQSRYFLGKDNALSTHGGAQTLQHFRDSASAAEAKRSIFRNEDYDSDTSQSSTSSELSDLLHQYTLDSKISRHSTKKLVSSYHQPSMESSQNATVSCGTMAADYEVAAMMSRVISPKNSPSFQRTQANGIHHAPPEAVPERQKNVDSSNREPVLTHHRRNSEPDYVNVPHGKEQHRNVFSTSQTLRSQGAFKASATPDVLDDDESLKSGGTLRIREHASPSNFPDNTYDGNSDRSSALSTPSPQTHPRQSHVPSETHHPSLRRRKWLEKPTQQVRQSTLEKSLSLQAELTQHRPLSMIVPFGSDSNAIVSQVADSLLQQMDIERFVAENLNEHRKGLLGKTVPMSNMLVWTKDIIQKPMIRTENRVVKRDAPELFRLIQVYMGDRKGRDLQSVVVALELLNKGWSCQELADEIYMQLCRQITKNPRDDSLLLGWELLGVCLSFFPPSPKFQSYLDGHIFRTLDTRDHTAEGRLHNYAICCHRRLDRICQSGSKRKPSLEEIEHSKKSLLEPSMFGGTLEIVMDLQKERYPNSRLPWIQTMLSEELLRLSPSQLTEGVFRVPGDTDEVNALKAKCDQWNTPSEGTDPHILASLLKLWYRELYEPLIPHEFYERCVESYADPVTAVSIIAELPALNQLVLSYLILFLQKFALPDIAAVTKMDANNLAMVMAPNCLRCQSTDPQVMFNNARKEVGFMRLLIQHLDTSVVVGVI